MRWTKHVAYVGRMRSTFIIFIRKLSGRMSFERPRYEVDIKMGLQ
jgi:hypothetical protein